MITTITRRSKPHAPVHIGTEAFTYDANGNQQGWQDDVSAQNRQINGMRKTG